ncbi:MAG: hypothetical protein GX127_07185 [Eubacteriaceae bacterium]|jgi:hypothetical protein|nr:hypothetical protein [Eubacteriaceae bacterium]
MGKARKIISLWLLIGLAVVVGTYGIYQFIRTYYFFPPMQEAFLVKKVKDIELDVSLLEDETMIPVMATYEASDYQEFSEATKKKLEDYAYEEEEDYLVLLIEDENTLAFEFYKEGKRITPEGTPSLTIQADALEYGETATVERPIESYREGRYEFRPKRVNPQHDLYYLEKHLMLLSYRIDGKDYVSLFSVLLSNAKEDADFMDNQELDEPILNME